MTDLYYFAYGSNLHPLRLVERVPSARHHCTVRLDCHRLAFHKRGKDGSGKCNIFCTEDHSDYVYGAIYKLAYEEKQRLDYFEGKGKGYSVSKIQIEHEDAMYNCFTYAAQSSHIDNDLLPYDWYRRLVVLGAQYLGMPDDYIEVFRKINCVADTHPARSRQHHELIEKLQAANSAAGTMPR